MTLSELPEVTDQNDFRCYNQLSTQAVTVPASCGRYRFRRAYRRNCQLKACAMRINFRFMCDPNVGAGVGMDAPNESMA